MNIQQTLDLFKSIDENDKANDILNQTNGKKVDEEIADLYIKFATWCNKQRDLFQNQQRKIIREHNYAIRCKAYTDLSNSANAFIKNDIFKSKALISLLDIIAERTVTYLNNAKIQYNTPTPAVVRQACFMTCYLMYHTIGMVQIIDIGEYDFTQCGVQSFVMKYLHNKTIALGHEFFAREDVLFTKGKWGKSPKAYCEDGLSYISEIPFQYAGHKDGVLGFMVREMIDSINYKGYTDVFGGSGRAVLQLNIKNDVEYRINDLNPCNYAFYNCMIDSDKYNKFINLIMIEQKEFLDIQEKYDNDIYDKATVNSLLRKKYVEYLDVYESINALPLEETAVCFVMLHNMLKRGKPPARSYKGSDFTEELKNVICRWNFKRDFIGVHNFYKKANVKISCKKDSQLIPSTSNVKEEILQLDPPYISTAQYCIGQYNYSDLITLLDSIKQNNSNRRFIYHCQTFYNATADDAERDVFTKVMKYWLTFTEDLYVTFAVEQKDSMAVSLPVNDASTLDDIVDAFLFVTNVNNNEGYYYNEWGKAIKNNFCKPQEIIITNFDVSIDKKYFIQNLINPYDRKQKKDSQKDYIIRTVDLKEYISKLLLLL